MRPRSAARGRTLRRRCSATSGERGRHYRVGLRRAPRLALWSSHRRADVAEGVANLSTGVTISEPSSRIDSYHPNETSQVRPLDRALRFGDASGWGPPFGHVATSDHAAQRLVQSTGILRVGLRGTELSLGDRCQGYVGLVAIVLQNRLSDPGTSLIGCGRSTGRRPVKSGAPPCTLRTLPSKDDRCGVTLSERVTLLADGYGGKLG
jgi:hypothetical protein